MIWSKCLSISEAAVWFWLQILICPDESRRRWISIRQTEVNPNYARLFPGLLGLIMIQQRRDLMSLKLLHITDLSQRISFPYDVTSDFHTKFMTTQGMPPIIHRVFAWVQTVCINNTYRPSTIQTCYWLNLIQTTSRWRLFVNQSHLRPGCPSWCTFISKMGQDSGNDGWESFEL